MSRRFQVFVFSTLLFLFNQDAAQSDPPGGIDGEYSKPNQIAPVKLSEYQDAPLCETLMTKRFEVHNTVDITDGSAAEAYGRITYKKLLDPLTFAAISEKYFDSISHKPGSGCLLESMRVIVKRDMGKIIGPIRIADTRVGDLVLSSLEALKPEVRKENQICWAKVLDKVPSTSAYYMAIGYFVRGGVNRTLRVTEEHPLRVYPVNQYTTDKLRWFPADEVGIGERLQNIKFFGSEVIGSELIGKKPISGTFGTFDVYDLRTDSQAYLAADIYMPLNLGLDTDVSEMIIVHNKPAN